MCDASGTEPPGKTHETMALKKRARTPATEPCKLKSATDMLKQLSPDELKNPQFL